MNPILILIGKIIGFFSRLFNLGSGSTWPGHIALSFNQNFIKELLEKNKLKIVLIAGTNGKTTTGKLIQAILEQDNKRVFQNTAGANLLNGIASSMLLHSSILCVLNYDFAIFEIDENTLPLILKELAPDYLILLNLFRDQLDRYGEVNSIAKKWSDALERLSTKTKLVLNADDPQVAFLGSSRGGISSTPLRWKTNVLFFGLKDKSLAAIKNQHASDSTYCPRCGAKLIYSTIYYSHLGDWVCKKCNCKHPQKTFTSSPFYPLPGVYSEYNTNAATLVARQIGIGDKEINSALRNFKPAFGRQETIAKNGKKVQLFLSKNPTSFNESLKTIRDLGAKNVLFVLNDRVPDGRDVSWIWDVEFEEFVHNFSNITVSGDRAYDMALRLKYATQTQNSNVKSQNYSSKFKIFEDLREAINESLKITQQNETLYILPTYSAMLEVRKILTGKKIL